MFGSQMDEKESEIILGFNLFPEVVCKKILSFLPVKDKLRSSNYKRNCGLKDVELLVQGIS